MRTVIEVYRKLHPEGRLLLAAPTGRASRNMAESTGLGQFTRNYTQTTKRGLLTTNKG